MKTLGSIVAINPPPTASARVRDVDDSSEAYIGDWVDLGSITSANIFPTLKELLTFLTLAVDVVNSWISYVSGTLHAGASTPTRV